MPYVYEPYKPEFPPLLPVGFHDTDLTQIRLNCVDPFGLSETRDLIMSCLEHIASILGDAGIVGDLWVDGSFLTTKIDPEDVDLVLKIHTDFADSASPEQVEVLNWFADEDRDIHRWLKSHCFNLVEFPAGHPQYWEGRWWDAYWLRQWGFSRGDVLKGIAVVKFQ